MDNLRRILVFFFISTCFSTFSSSSENHDNTKEYIVYMGSVTSSEYSTTSQQQLNVLQQVLNGRSVEESITQSYHKSFSGFAARLTEQEYEQLKGMEEVVSIFPSRTLQLHTTRSWDFLGLPLPTRKERVAASNVIVGVIDTGIWPESPSFKDDGLGPIPKKWKGICQTENNVTCNKKLIGVRGYELSGRDEQGHGTHTASTAAGSIVKDASFYGIGKGLARGAVPTARIAAYRVCDEIQGCSTEKIMKAFDDAIDDGVDVISISIGGNATVFDQDPIAIGAFHAMQKGILTVQSAGNDGNASGTVGSVAPWIFTAAASTTDRRLVDKVVLGNGKTFIGNSVNGFTMKKEKFPLLYGKGVSTHCEESESRMCFEGCLATGLVKGKIVVCDNKTPYNSALQSGAAGVLAELSFDNVSFVTPLPASALSVNDLETIEAYVNTTKAPFAKILKTEAVSDTNAPIVAGFSSRGPNTIASDILKPDIAAPGVNILAAFSPTASVSQFPADGRSVAYNVLSGTSMACPHLAGAVAYLKSFHPDWSPSALKSALMTTATPMGPEKNEDEEFSYGSGHLNPKKAVNPGLVYETNQDDYIRFLCKLDYGTSEVRRISGNNSVSCPKKRDESNDNTPKDVNYPSISAMVEPEKTIRLTFSRIVTNVGGANSTYTAKVASSSPTVKVIVKPNTLSFKRLKEKKSFEVTISGKGLNEQTLVTGSLVWSDGNHSVRSPIVVYT